MKIFCLLCREHVLNTTEKFEIGKKYTGDMFSCATADKSSATMFPTRADITEGSLQCPRCTGLFIQGGAILTEHGVIQPDQKSVDKTKNIVWKDGQAKGRLKTVEDSREEPEKIQAPQPKVSNKGKKKRSHK